MPAKYSVVAKVNPQDPEGPRKFYPSYKSSGRAGRRTLALEAADRSTLSDADMDASLANMLTLIPKHLAMGEIVDLGDFGTFRLSIRTEGADTAEEVTARHIKKVNVRFTPGPAFKEMLGQVKFVKAE